jgi:hypothetical protein
LIRLGRGKRGGEERLGLAAASGLGEQLGAQDAQMARAGIAVEIGVGGKGDSDYRAVLAELRMREVAQAIVDLRQQIAAARRALRKLAADCPTIA